MCLAKSNVRAAVQWNWEGDFIIQDQIVQAHRKIAGTDKTYVVDIREFITCNDNAVMRHALADIRKGLSAKEKTKFMSREQGAFDFRAMQVISYLMKHVKYEASSRDMDDWLFPEETLAKGSGDCEDRAFLFASMLLASGISGYMVRVALGKIYSQTTDESYDHAWVMYKNENGLWMLLEPHLFTKVASKKTVEITHKKKKIQQDAIEYIPYFVFNGEHLWGIKNNTTETSFESYLVSRAYWKEFDPKFAAGVHNSILDEAFADMDEARLAYLKAVSLAMDLNPTAYDPRDHFDNGYIDQSWARVDKCLADKSLDGLARAAHTIADFYAHTSYGHFAKQVKGKMVLYKKNASPDELYGKDSPNYTTPGFDLQNSKRFTTNDAKCCKSDRDTCIPKWQGEIISGRWAQPSDPHQGFLEKVFNYIPYSLRTAEDFPPRTCLPHHNEIAVDTELDHYKIPNGHTLYDDPKQFQTQYELRKEAAVRHIGEAYSAWGKKNS